MKFISVLSLPIVILIAFNSYNINYLVFGSGYKEGYKGLMYIIWTILPLGYNYILGHVLISINKQKYCAVSLSIASVINIILNYLLIPKYSFTGTCIALLITEIIIFIFYAYYVEKFLGSLNIAGLAFKLLSIIFVLFGVFYLLTTISVNLYLVSVILLGLSAILLIKTRVLDYSSFKEIVLAKNI